MKTQRKYLEPDADELIDDNESAAEANELDFNDEEPTARAGERQSDAADRGSITGKAGSVADTDPTNDDLMPETLIHEDGARSPAEAGGGNTPADRTLTRKHINDIGAGQGLDEAELGRADPLDGEPWDGESQ